MSAMPSPPAGTVWKLSFSTLHDDAMLWLYKRPRFGKAVDSIVCAGVHSPAQRSFDRLKVSTATVDLLVDGVVVTAHELIRKMADGSDRKTDLDAKAAEVAQRLGIQVEVRR